MIVLRHEHLGMARRPRRVHDSTANRRSCLLGAGSVDYVAPTCAGGGLSVRLLVLGVVGDEFISDLVVAIAEEVGGILHHGAELNGQGIVDDVPINSLSPKCA